MPTLREQFEEVMNDYTENNNPEPMMQFIRDLNDRIILTENEEWVYLYIYISQKAVIYSKDVKFGPIYKVLLDLMELKTPEIKNHVNALINLKDYFNQTFDNNKIFDYKKIDLSEFVNKMLIKGAAKSQNSLVRTCRDITEQGLTAKGKDDNGNDVEITLPPEVMSMIVNFVSPLPEENLGSSLFDIMKLQSEPRVVYGSKAQTETMMKEKGFVKKLKKEAENPSPPQQGPLK